MNKRTLCALLVVLAVSGLPALAQDQKELPLTLEDSIVRALKSNLDVAVQVFSPEVARAALSQAKEFYSPTFGVTFSRDRSEQPATWAIQNTETSVSNYLSSQANLTQQIPLGGNVSVSLSYYWNKTNQLFQNFNPYYQSTLDLSFTQPLLRNFGWTVSRSQIIIAQNSLEGSRSQLKSTLINTIFQVEQAYWNLVYSIENLKVAQQSLTSGRDLLAKTKKEVEVGQTAPIEVLNAEAEVARREAGILQAEAMVRRSRDQLRALLNLDSDPEAKGKAIVPADKPTYTPVQVTLDDAVQQALLRRPDLDVEKTTIETRKVDFAVAKNRLLPQLDLTLNKTSPGISGDKLLYLNDDPFSGVIIGVEPGSAGQSLRDAFKFLYNNWSIGLTLRIPFGDVIGRSAYAQAKLDLQQEEARLKSLEQQVYLDVSDAVLSLETDAKSVEATRIAREFAEKRLEAEMKKLSVGLTTNYFVLTYQDALASAQSAELKALVDYNVSVARIDWVTGSTLEKRNISLADYSGEK
jgi:outer membrane protein TolC